MKRNIKFLNKKVKYNAIKKFDNRIVKLPSYVVDEVFKKKMQISIYHKGELLKTYSYDNLFSYIVKTEDKEYHGSFRKKPITYRLVNVEV